MTPKNLRNFTPSQSSGKDAKSGGHLSGTATPRTKAENETNRTVEAYSSNAPKSNLGGKNTGM